VLIVDAPEGSEAVLDALGSAEVSDVVLTHSHRDHWGGHEVLRGRTAVPFSVGAHEVNLDAVAAGGPLARLEDGAALEVGTCRVRVIQTPGHRARSPAGERRCSAAPRSFPAARATHGPLGAAQDLSITGRLYVLSREHRYAGTARARHQRLTCRARLHAREHAPDLRSDVLWASSNDHSALEVD
jgi:hypothetical protein